MYNLREEFKITDQHLSQDYINISYCLGDQTEDMNIKLDYPEKKDFETFTHKFENAEKNFNIYAKMLTETSNKALDSYKKIYRKLKGKEWLESENPLIVISVPCI